MKPGLLTLLVAWHFHTCRGQSLVPFAGKSSGPPAVDACDTGSPLTGGSAVRVSPVDVCKFDLRFHIVEAVILDPCI
jgi:hypothetical protein